MPSKPAKPAKPATVARVKFRGPVRTAADRARFFDALLDAGLNFHPDTPFDDYVNLSDNTRSFSDREARRLDALMAQCFEVRGDPYGAGLAAMARWKRKK